MDGGRSSVASRTSNGTVSFDIRYRLLILASDSLPKLAISNCNSMLAVPDPHSDEADTV